MLAPAIQEGVPQERQPLFALPELGHFFIEPCDEGGLQATEAAKLLGDFGNGIVGSQQDEAPLQTWLLPFWRAGGPGPQVSAAPDQMLAHTTAQDFGRSKFSPPHNDRF